MHDVVYKQAGLNYSGDAKLSALLSKFGNLDSEGDIMREGCYDKFLAKQGDKPLRMLKAHQKNDWPLGWWTNLRVDSEGLHADGQLAVEENPEAAVAAKMLKAGMVDGVSVGFILKAGKRMIREQGVIGRDVTEAEVFEASIVPVKPANPAAVVGEIDGAKVQSIYKMDVETRNEVLEELTREAMEEWRFERAAVEAFMAAWGVGKVKQ